MLEMGNDKFEQQDYESACVLKSGGRCQIDALNCFKLGGSQRQETEYYEYSKHLVLDSCCGSSVNDILRAVA
jgi:hypothetical protein